MTRTVAMHLRLAAGRDIEFCPTAEELSVADHENRGCGSIISTLEEEERVFCQKPATARITKAMMQSAESAINTLSQTAANLSGNAFFDRIEKQIQLLKKQHQHCQEIEWEGAPDDDEDEQIEETEKFNRRDRDENLSLPKSSSSTTTWNSASVPNRTRQDTIEDSESTCMTSDDQSFLAEFDAMSFGPSMTIPATPVQCQQLGRPVDPSPSFCSFVNKKGFRADPDRPTKSALNNPFQELDALDQEKRRKSKSELNAECEDNSASEEPRPSTSYQAAKGSKASLGRTGADRSPRKGGNHVGNHGGFSMQASPVRSPTNRRPRLGAKYLDTWPSCENMTDRDGFQSVSNSPTSSIRWSRKNIMTNRGSAMGISQKSCSTTAASSSRSLSKHTTASNPSLLVPVESLPPQKPRRTRDITFCPPRISPPAPPSSPVKAMPPQSPGQLETREKENNKMEPMAEAVIAQPTSHIAESVQDAISRLAIGHYFSLQVELRQGRGPLDCAPDEPPQTHRRTTLPIEGANHPKSPRPQDLVNCKPPTRRESSSPKASPRRISQPVLASQEGEQVDKGQNQGAGMPRQSRSIEQDLERRRRASLSPRRKPKQTQQRRRASIGVDEQKVTSSPLSPTRTSNRKASQDPASPSKRTGAVDRTKLITIRLDLGDNNGEGEKKIQKHQRSPTKETPAERRGPSKQESASVEEGANADNEGDNERQYRDPTWAEGNHEAFRQSSRSLSSANRMPSRRTLYERVASESDQSGCLHQIAEEGSDSDREDLHNNLNQSSSSIDFHNSMSNSSQTKTYSSTTLHHTSNRFNDSNLMIDEDEDDDDDDGEVVCPSPLQRTLPKKEGASSRENSRFNILLGAQLGAVSRASRRNLYERVASESSNIKRIPQGKHVDGENHPSASDSFSAADTPKSSLAAVAAAATAAPSSPMRGQRHRLGILDRSALPQHHRNEEAADTKLTSSQHRFGSPPRRPKMFTKQ